MKKILLAGVAGCALFIVNSASADVNVLANIDKTKTITVTENITITKTVDLTAVVDVTPGKAAESTGVVNQGNWNNEACGNCAEKLDTISDSINDSNGIVNVNQSSGNMNNQGNAVSVAWDAVRPPEVPPPPPGQPPSTPGASGFANSQAHMDQKNGAFNLPQETTGGIGISGNLVDTVNLVFRDAVITDSINGNTGIVGVNQSAGNINNQANQLSLAVSLLGDTHEGGVALSEADLGQLNVSNSAHESDSAPLDTTDIQIGINKSASMTGSVSNNVGIVGVNQGAGNMANQGNNVSAAFVVVGGSL
jgi:hypothetical protein